MKGFKNTSSPKNFSDDNRRISSVLEQYNEEYQLLLYLNENRFPFELGA
jgi:hypothetical protein